MINHDKTGNKLNCCQYGGMTDKKPSCC